MKLIIITAVQEFEKQIKKILFKSNTKVFSYMPITGYKDISLDTYKENWFGGDMPESESVVFMAFVPEENVDVLFDNFKEFNDNDKFSSRIHVATVNLERSI